MASIVIYTTRFCPYCTMAKRLLAKKQVNYEEIPVDGDRDLRQKMEDLSGGYTVPQIFINDKAIGGFDQLNALETSGKLDSLLSE